MLNAERALASLEKTGEALTGIAGGNVRRSYCDFRLEESSARGGEVDGGEKAKRRGAEAAERSAEADWKNGPDLFLRMIHAACRWNPRRSVHVTGDSLRSADCGDDGALR